jgi:hypothetical protein
VQVSRNPGDNSYCGPAALSLLTGYHVSLCAHELRQINGRRYIKSASDYEMVAVLIRLGKRVREVPLYPNHVCVTLRRKPTLVGLVRLLRDRTPHQRFLIRTTDHFMVLRGRMVYDNLNPEGVFFGKYNHRRYRVRACWEVSA